MAILPALVVQAMAQMPPMSRPDARDIFPGSGARPELLTVLDMRKDVDPADRILAQSAEGLMNSDPLRTDKIYLVLSDQDETFLNWLVSQQYVLSAGHMADLEDLLRRNPSRDALLCTSDNARVAATMAGCERLLVVTDPRLISTYHLNVRKALKKTWHSDADAANWLIERYGDKVNRRIVAQDSDSSMLDYEVANRVFSFAGQLDGSLEHVLTNSFDSNIPCLIDMPPSQMDANTTTILSASAKFLVPTQGLSNLSLWTSFRPHQASVDQVNSGATAQPRAIYKDADGSLRTFDAWQGLDDQAAIRADVWLRELAPPLFEGWSRKLSFDSAMRGAFEFGIIDPQAYGADFGADRDRIVDDYDALSRNAWDLAVRR